MSRLWRDTASNSVWEGTTNVLASETVRHLAKEQHLKLFDSWIVRSMDQIFDSAFHTTLSNIWDRLKMKLTAGQSDHELPAVLGVGRQIIFTLAWLVCGILLALDAQRDGDEVAREVARRWVIEGQGVPGEFAFTDLIYQRSTLGLDSRPTDKEHTEWDFRIVWGVELPVTASVGYRLSRI